MRRTNCDYMPIEERGVTCKELSLVAQKLHERRCATPDTEINKLDEMSFSDRFEAEFHDLAIAATRDYWISDELYVTIRPAQKGRRGACIVVAMEFVDLGKRLGANPPADALLELAKLAGQIAMWESGELQTMPPSTVRFDDAGFIVPRAAQ